MRKSKIMIVEDEVIISIDLKNRLEKMGFEVCAEAATGEEAVAKARCSRPDMVFMDVVLKGKMEGLDAAYEIGRNMSIPIVFLSAYDELDIAGRFNALAPAAFVRKPFLDRQIRRAVRMALGCEA